MINNALCNLDSDDRKGSRSKCRRLSLSTIRTFIGASAGSAPRMFVAARFLRKSAQHARRMHELTLAIAFAGRVPWSKAA